MIAPTVGRIVLFFVAPGVLEQAAIVTHVQGDRMVNLCAFRHNGEPMPTTLVPLIQPEDDLPAHGHHCTWPPHVAAQAPRKEAVPAKTDESHTRIEGP